MVQVLILNACAGRFPALVILLHLPLSLVGVSIGMERGCQHNDRTLADGSRYADRFPTWVRHGLQLPFLSRMPTAAIG